jgi:hypothetical protein
MQLPMIHLLILALTFAILAAFFFSLSSRRYVWAAASVLVFVALYYGAEPYQKVGPNEPLVLQRK